MASLDTLPTEIIGEITQHLDVPPSHYTLKEQRFHPKKDLLSLASTSKRLRSIFFDQTWVKEHVMGFSWANIVTSMEEVDESVRSKVECVSRIWLTPLARS
jgi:hypothetical protein